MTNAGVSKMFCLTRNNIFQLFWSLQNRIFLVTDLFANKILPCSGHWLIVVKFWQAYIVNVLHMSLLDFFSRRSHWILENIIKLSALSVGQANKGLNKSRRACLLFMMIG